MGQDLLLCNVIEPATPAKFSIIWLHGLGADKNDFADIPRLLELPESSGVRFIFPDARFRTVTINQGAKMRAWYDIMGLDVSAREDEEGICQSEQDVAALIQQEKAKGIPSDHIILAGFSQGGAMALHCGLRYPEALGGIMALSTYLPIFEVLKTSVSVANKNIPIFMAHGSYDMIVPKTWAEVSHDRLKKLGYQVTWHTYPMEHTMCIEEVQDISQWLQKKPLQLQ